MRPAIEAGLMVLLEAAGPYMRPVLALSKVTFCLSKSWSRAPIIGKPANEKWPSSAFSAFSAFFLETGDPQPQSKMESTVPGTGPYLPLGNSNRLAQPSLIKE